MTLTGTYRVLIVDLPTALADRYELTISTAVVGRVEACLAAGLVDDIVQDGAEEVVVLRVAGVLVSPINIHPDNSQC